MPRRDDGAKRPLEVASSLRTYSEFMEKDLAREKAKEMVQQAERLILLGFGFHEQNLGMLKPDMPSKVSESTPPRWRPMSLRVRRALRPHAQRG
jgi:hypothetical protein